MTIQKLNLTQKEKNIETPEADVECPSYKKTRGSNLINDIILKKVKNLLFNQNTEYMNKIGR